MTTPTSEPAALREPELTADTELFKQVSSGAKALWNLTPEEMNRLWRVVSS